MWDIIINPFITMLAFLYSILGHNIVLAIAVFTIIIRLVTSPLMMKQQQSSKKMQELQPKLKKLQEKYKNDKEKLAQEQMAMYKEYGVNPLGGCLPLLVQMPVLLGLYQAIILALAGTPYQLMGVSGRLLIPGLDHLIPLNSMWIGLDLTQSPLTNSSFALVFPILVMGTTWLQSKLTMPAPQEEAGAEPNQGANIAKSMTTVMPIMFGFFSLSFSVGISIYFIVSNLAGIAQYTLMGKAEWGQLLDSFSNTSTTKKSQKPKVIDSKAEVVATSTSPKDEKEREDETESVQLLPKRKKKMKKMQRKTTGS